MTDFIETELKKTENKFKIFNLLNQIIPVLMGIFIFFNPFPHTTAIKEISFYLSAGFVLVLIILKKTEFTLRTPLSLPFGLFVFWAFLSIFWALNVGNSIHDFYAHLVKYIIFFFILINFYNSKRRLVCISWIVIISSTVFSIGGLFYYYITLGNPLSNRFAIGFQHIPTDFVGFVTLFAIILILNHFSTDNHAYRRSILIICLFALLSATILTQSRSSLIALLLAGSIMLINKKRNMFIFMMILLTVIVSTPLGKRFSFQKIMNNERIPNYYIIFEIVKRYPIIGIGFGMETYGTDLDLEAYEKKLPPEIKSIPAPILNDPHSMLCSVAVRLGLVGLVLFLYIIFVFGKMSVKCIKEGKDTFIKSWGRCIGSAFVGFFIIGIFEPSSGHMQEIVFFTIFSMITILWRLNEKSTNCPEACYCSNSDIGKKNILWGKNTI
jgi:O-antigen ligase